MSSGVWWAVIGRSAIVNVVGAPARTAGRSASEVLSTSIPTTSQAAASSSVAGQVWQSRALPLSATRSATVKFRSAGFPP